MPVLQILLSKFLEIRRTYFNDFRIAPEIGDDAAAVYLSPTDAMLCDAIRQHGGEVSRWTLTEDPVKTRRREKITMNMAFMSSPVFRRHDRGIWAITGFSFSHEAPQKACEAKRQIQLVDGWYEMEAAPPRSALERGDWIVPARSQAHLTPGDYQLSRLGARPNMCKVR